MLEVDEVSSEWSVLLAMIDRETVRLLSVVLDGFGYLPLECHDRESAFEHLSRTTPFAAVVDTRMDKADDICNMVRQRGGVGLVVLLEEGEEDPQAKMSRWQADAWAPVLAGPEKLLLTLRKLAGGSSA